MILMSASVVASFSLLSVRRFRANRIPSDAPPACTQSYRHLFAPLKVASHCSSSSSFGGAAGVAVDALGAQAKADSAPTAAAPVAKFATNDRRAIVESDIACLLDVGVKPWRG